MSKGNYRTDNVRIKLQGDQEAVERVLAILFPHRESFTRFRDAVVVICTNPKSKTNHVASHLEIPAAKFREIIRKHNEKDEPDS